LYPAIGRDSLSAGDLSDAKRLQLLISTAGLLGKLN